MMIMWKMNCRRGKIIGLKTLEVKTEKLRIYSTAYNVKDRNFNKLVLSLRKLTKIALPRILLIFFKIRKSYTLQTEKKISSSKLKYFHRFYNQITISTVYCRICQAKVSFNNAQL